MKEISMIARIMGRQTLFFFGCDDGGKLSLFSVFFISCLPNLLMRDHNLTIEWLNNLF
jgi:hypothetical protein